MYAACNPDSNNLPYVPGFVYRRLRLPSTLPRIRLLGVAQAAFRPDGAASLDVVLAGLGPRYGGLLGIRTSPIILVKE